MAALLQMNKAASDNELSPHGSPENILHSANSPSSKRGHKKGKRKKCVCSEIKSCSFEEKLSVLPCFNNVNNSE